MNLSRYWFRVLFFCLLMAFSVYVLLDTFVIVRRYETASVTAASAPEITATAAADLSGEEKQAEAEGCAVTLSASVTSGAEEEPAVTDTSYQDENISVNISEYRISGTTVYVADVLLSSPDYLKTALAQNTYGRNVTERTSEMAEAVDAVLAVNGDYYGAQQSGYVIRNGVLYRNKAEKGAEDLVIYADGSFAIIREDEVSAEQLLADGAWNVLNFGPALVENGQIAVTRNEEVGRAKASNPRTAIALIDPLHYLFVVSDGRTDESEGLSLYELAAFLQELGAETAYNLDGGGSSTMVFNGTVLNETVSGGRGSKERSVSDIVYIG